MRVILVFALAFALVAGCTSPDEGPTPTPTPTATPEVTPTATTTPEANVTPTPTATPDTNVTPTPTPAPPPTFSNVTIRHDYSNASENLTFAIPDGFTGLTISVQFDAAPTAVPGQYGCVGALRLKVIRPDGTLQHDVTASPGTGTAGSHCGMVSAGGQFPTDVPPGVWHAAFEGSGVGIGWVRVTQTSA